MIKGAYRGRGRGVVGEGVAFVRGRGAGEEVTVEWFGESWAEGV